MDTATSFVRVTEFYRTTPGRDPVSLSPGTYSVFVDYGIGAVDDGAEGYYTYGWPSQIYPANGTNGEPGMDSHILIAPERLAEATLATSAGFGTDTVHFKNPGI